MGTGIGIVFVLLGRRILDGKPGVSGRGTSPGFSHPSCKERNKAATSNLDATKKVSDNENVHHRQTCGGLPVLIPSVTSQYHGLAGVGHDAGVI